MRGIPEHDVGMAAIRDVKARLVEARSTAHSAHAALAAAVAEAAAADATVAGLISRREALCNAPLPDGADPFARLPDHLLQQVMQCLPGITVLKSMPLVCRRWHRITGTASITSHFALSIKLRRYSHAKRSPPCCTFPGWSAVNNGPEPGPIAPSAIEPEEIAGSDGVGYRIVVHRDGRVYAAGGNDGAIKAWDADYTALPDLAGHPIRVEAMALSPDGNWLCAAAETDATIRVWDTRSSTVHSTLVGHTDGVYALAFSPDGRALYSGASDSIRVWSMMDGSHLRTLPGDGSAVTTLAVAPDGQRLYSGPHDKGIRVWSAADGARVRTLEVACSEPGRSIGSRRFTPQCSVFVITLDGRRLYSTWGDGIQEWSIPDGVHIRTMHADDVAALVVSPDGRLLLSGSAEDNTIRVWNRVDGTVKSDLEGAEFLEGYAYEDGGPPAAFLETTVDAGFAVNALVFLADELRWPNALLGIPRSGHQTLAIELQAGMSRTARTR